MTTSPKKQSDSELSPGKMEPSPNETTVIATDDTDGKNSCELKDAEGVELAVEFEMKGDPGPQDVTYEVSAAPKEEADAIPNEPRMDQMVSEGELEPTDTGTDCDEEYLKSQSIDRAEPAAYETIPNEPRRDQMVSDGVLEPVDTGTDCDEESAKAQSIDRVEPAPNGKNSCELNDAEGVELAVEFEMKGDSGPQDVTYEVSAAPKEEADTIPSEPRRAQMNSEGVLEPVDTGTDCDEESSKSQSIDRVEPAANDGSPPENEDVRESEFQELPGDCKTDIKEPNDSRPDTPKETSEVAAARDQDGLHHVYEEIGDSGSQKIPHDCKKRLKKSIERKPGKPQKMNDANPKKTKAIEDKPGKDDHDTRKPNPTNAKAEKKPKTCIEIVWANMNEEEIILAFLTIFLFVLLTGFLIYATVIEIMRVQTEESG